MTSLHQPAYGLDSGAPPLELAGREVVVGFDDTSAALAALGWAGVEADRLRAPLRVLYAADAPGVARWPLAGRTGLAELGSVSRQVAARGAALARSQNPGLAVDSLGMVGGAAAELIAQSADAGLVVVGRRARGAVESAVLGSVSFAVAMHARCPVVVVQEGADWHPVSGGRAVVVGIDGSRAAQGALALATQFARAWAARLHVVSAWQVAAGEPWSDMYGAAPDLAAVRDAAAETAGQHVAGALERLRADSPDLEAWGEAVEGAAVDVLVRASRDAGLVVVGSRGYGGFAGMMLGSVSHAVLRRAHSPVAVVRRGAW